MRLNFEDKIFKDRADVLAKIPESQCSVAVKRLLVFQLGQQQYGLDDKCVEQVLLQQEITRIPLISKPFLGIIYNQGEICPVIDTFQVILNRECPEDLNGYELILLRFKELSLVLKVTEVKSQVENNEKLAANIKLIDPIIFSDYLNS